MSLQHDFTVVLVTDPAVALPPDGDEAARAAFAQAWQVARDSGDYTPVLTPGAVPVKWGCRLIPTKVLRRLNDRLTATGTSNWIGAEEGAAIAVQLGLVSVVGRDLKFTYANDPTWGRIVSDETIGKMKPIEVTELGNHLFERSHASPKS